MQVSVIGLGEMGRAIAERALSCGHQVTVWNRSIGRAAALCAVGAVVAPEIADAVRSCDVALLVVSDDAAVRELCLGETGVLGLLPDGATLVNVSTVSPDTVRLLESQSPTGRVIDAPVMGSPSSVRAGQAKFFLAGGAALVEELTPFWKDLSERSYFCGAVGQASVLKIVSNSLMILHLIALAEFTTVARLNGIGDELLREVLEDSVVTSQADRLRLDSLVSDDHDGWFAPALALKDLRLGLTLAADHDLVLRMGSAAEWLLTRLVDQTRMWPDVSAVVEVVRGT